MKEHSDVARALAALGHETRLSVFRLLVKAGDAGLNVGEIGRHMGAAPSTLAHHLGALVEAGLVVQERRGREVRNRVDYGATQGILAFLTDECCVGLSLTTDDAA